MTTYALESGTTRAVARQGRRTAISSMREGHRGLATYGKRQMDSSSGFHGVTDFWGAL